MIGIKNIIICLLVLMTNFVFSQNSIVLQKRDNQTKIKKISTDRVFYIKTKDTTYYSKIFYNTDTTIAIIHSVKTGNDTTVSYNIGKGKDTTISVPLYGEDTLLIRKSDIHLLEKDLLKRKGWTEPFALLGVGVVLGLGALPIVAIYDGGSQLENWAKLEVTLVALSVPAIILRNLTIKYELKTKWAFVSSP